MAESTMWDHLRKIKNPEPPLPIKHTGNWTTSGGVKVTVCEIGSQNVRLRFTGESSGDSPFFQSKSLREVAKFLIELADQFDRPIMGL